VVFIQSPGRATTADFDYAGAVTSLVALKQAKYVREDYPEDGKAFVFYQHMRTPGLQEISTKDMQQDPGIFLTKGPKWWVFPRKRRGPDRGGRKHLLGEKLQVKADLVVLGTGMVPVTKDDPVVNLAYRQGPAFRDNRPFQRLRGLNFICFPLRNPAHRHLCRRRHPPQHDHRRGHGGRHRCGPQGHPVPGVGQPRHVRPSALGRYDLSGLLLPALHPVQALHRGMSLRALDDDEKGTPKPNPARCRRCGTCMGACPERIIGFADYNIDSIGSMVKAIGVPSEDDYDEPPLRILGLVCENDAYPALDMAGSRGCPTRRMCA
jgi:quinone-modifying oxidoreductase subunit QmoB